ncbi:fumarylacetoacetate hydrolase family protein [Streptomyces sp. L7]
MLAQRLDLCAGSPATSCPAGSASSSPSPPARSARGRRHPRRTRRRLGRRALPGLRVSTAVNGVRLGTADAAEGMFFTYPELIAHACRTRDLAAGTVLGAGSISNDGPGRRPRLQSPRRGSPRASSTAESRPPRISLLRRGVGPPSQRP